MWLNVKKVFNLDRRRCIATLLILTLTTAFVVYRFGKLQDTQIFEGSSKPVELTLHEDGKQSLFIGSVGPCAEIEDSGCKKCTANDLKHNARECAVNGFVKFSTCIFTNGSSSPNGIPQNCTISSQEHSELAYFEVSALSLAVVSTAYVIRRQRQLQEDLQQRVNKMIAST